jgi:hypothetical protein
VVGVNGDAFGPGKAQLLEQIQQTGSLREAAVRLQMSYMKAWRLANRMNENFREPLLEKNPRRSCKRGNVSDSNRTPGAHHLPTDVSAGGQGGASGLEGAEKAATSAAGGFPTTVRSRSIPHVPAKCTRRSLPGMEETWDAKTA